MILSWDLPSFRFIGVDGIHRYLIVLKDIVKASCLHRQGDIIFFDDFTNGNWAEVGKAIFDLFSLYGTEVLAPLLIISNKLHVCTAKEDAMYKKYIREHIEPTMKIKVKVTQFWGNNCTYFTV